MSPARIVIFLLIASAILFGAHYYIWARLVRDPVLPAPWSTVLSWTVAALGVLVLVGFVASRAVSREIASPLLWITYTWLGAIFFLLVLLGLVDFGRLATGVVRRLASADPVDPERRTFLARLLGGGVGIATLGLAATSVYNALGAVAVKQVRVPIKRLPDDAAGYRIVQLTDIHVGPTIGKDFIEDLVARTNALEPDLIAITGDLVDGSVEELGPLVAPLANLRAKEGVYFVTGNHEYYSGVEEWAAFLTQLGIRVLRDERIALPSGIDLAGIDDPTGRPDMARALAGRDPARPLVLLAHQPRSIDEAADRGVDLQLSGHTHGGQMFPFNLLVRLQQPYVAGLHDHRGTRIYVSNGTGYWGPPMRLGAPAEITEISLVPA